MDLIQYRIDRDNADRLLILLHGWSAEQHHLAAYVPLVDPGERFTAICPRGPYDLPEGDGASWYERRTDGPEPASFLASLEAIETMIAAEAKARAIPVERCVVGGFSQGGFLSVALATKPNALPYAGLWAMCCGVPDVVGLELDFAQGADRPALIQFGERDAIIAPDRGRALAATLAAGRWTTQIEGYDMAHSQSVEMMLDARTWLAAI